MEIRCAVQVNTDIGTDTELAEMGVSMGDFMCCSKAARCVLLIQDVSSRESSSNFFFIFFSFFLSFPHEFFVYFSSRLPTQFSVRSNLV